MSILRIRSINIELRKNKLISDSENIKKVRGIYHNKGNVLVL